MLLPLKTKLSLGLSYLKHRHQLAIGFVVVLFLITLRLMAPHLILGKINEHGKVMNPIYTLHAKDLKLSLLTGSLTLIEPALTLKSAPEKFMKASALNLDIDMLSTLKGKFAYDEWEIKDWVVTITPAVQKAYKKPKYKKPNTLSINKISAKDATLIVTTLDEKLVVHPISGYFTYFGANRMADYHFNSESDLGKLDIKGKINPNVRPLDYDINLKLQDFKLAELNTYIGSKLPVKILKGELEVFFEGESHNKVLKGYIKPFAEKVEVTTKKKDEGMIGSIVEWYMDDKQNRTFGVRVPFILDHGKLGVDESFTLKALKAMLKNPPKKGIENLYRL